MNTRTYTVRHILNRQVFLGNSCTFGKELQLSLPSAHMFGCSPLRPSAFWKRYSTASTPSQMGVKSFHSHSLTGFARKGSQWSIRPCVHTQERWFSGSKVVWTGTDQGPPEPTINPQAGIHMSQCPPRSILLVNKLRTDPIVRAIDDLLNHVRTIYPDVKIYAEDRPDAPNGAQVWRSGPSAAPVDLVVTLGGDGTILHAASLFSHGAVPPVLSFSMGTLGFLLPFHIDDYVKGLEAVFSGKATILHRMRLSCSFYDREGRKIGSDAEAWQVMNEVALHRGSSPHLNTIDIYVDGQHLTEAVSDGMIVSTPTGSTAYSLSAGGPIVHPSLSAVLLVPICPRSLSFRPLVFPSSSSITLRIGDKSRAAAGVSMDGRTVHVLNPGESVTVQASPYPVPCINRSSIVDLPLPSIEGQEGVGPGKEDDWVRDINNLLQYNATFRSKALLRYSRGGDGS